MTFSGRVEEISHMRGLLVSFEGRSPNLGDTIRVGARHANPTHDELGVTGVLEKVK